MSSERTDYMQDRAIGPAPLGFRHVGPGQHFEIVTVELDAVGTILERRGLGRSLRAIARELDARGIPTKFGRRRWSAQSVLLICRSAGRYANALRSRRMLAHEREAHGQ